MLTRSSTSIAAHACADSHSSPIERCVSGRRGVSHLQTALAGRSLRTLMTLAQRLASAPRGAVRGPSNPKIAARHQSIKSTEDRQNGEGVHFGRPAAWIETSNGGPRAKMEAYEG
eukprot:1800431-Pleurochrysis_carterae.AAC.10